MKQIIWVVSILIILIGKCSGQVFYDYLGKAEKQVLSAWGEPILNNVEGFKMLSYVTNNEGTITHFKVGKGKAVIIFAKEMSLCEDEALAKSMYEDNVNYFLSQKFTELNRTEKGIVLKKKKLLITMSYYQQEDGTGWLVDTQADPM